MLLPHIFLDKCTSNFMILNNRTVSKEIENNFYIFQLNMFNFSFHVIIICGRRTIDLYLIMTE